MLATVEELRRRLELPVEDFEPVRAEEILEAATGRVQETAQNSITLANGDTVSLIGHDDPWLLLPNGPVHAVTAVNIDGAPASGYKLVGDKLHRYAGWGGPLATVTVTYDHGYPPDDPKHRLATDITLAYASRVYVNPEAALQRRTGSDSSVSFNDSSEAATGLTKGEIAALQSAFPSAQGRMVSVYLTR